MKTRAREFDKGGNGFGKWVIGKLKAADSQFIYQITKITKFPNCQMPSTDPRRFPFPPGITFAGWLLAWGLGKIWPISLTWPAWTRPVGIVVMVLAFCNAVWAVFTFRRHKTEVNPLGKVSTIVTAGPYRVTRNPMYVSLVVLYCGGILAFHLPWSVVLLPGVFVALHYGVILREERYLQAAFGEPYAAYCRQVRRWL